MKRRLRRGFLRVNNFLWLTAMPTQQPDKPQVRQPADKYIVRLPDGMRDRLKAEAKASRRTLNAEIVARLQSTFEQSATGMSTEALLLELAYRLGPTFTLAVGEVGAEPKNPAKG